MWSSGRAAPSPKVFSPPLGSTQKPPDDSGKNAAVAASAILPPPAGHAAGLAGGGGGGGPRRGSSLPLHAARHAASVERASAEAWRRSVACMGFARLRGGCE